MQQPSRNSPRILAAELLKKRLECKSRNKKNLIHNQAELMAIGSYSQGYRPSLVVSSEGRSYLFNCNEGTQRLCYANKIKIVNLEHLFITNLSWNQTAGAFGLALTLQDVGATDFTIHAPKGIERFFDSTRTFITFNSGIRCSTRNHLQGDYKDESIHVRTVVLDQEDRINESGEDGMIRVVKKTKRSAKLVAYVCSLPDLPGHLDPNKCRELNVPIGPMLAILKSGGNVTLEDGTVVKTSDVVGPKDPAMHFIVIECPTESHIDLICNNTTLESFRKFRTANNEQQIDVVVHFSPTSVVEHPRYQEWIKGFSEYCKHLLMFNEELGQANFVDVYRFQYLLNQLDNVIFPKLYMSYDLVTQIEKEAKELEAAHTNGDIIINPDDAEIGYTNSIDIKNLSEQIKMRSLDKFIIRPHKSLQCINPKVDIDAQYRAIRDDPEFIEHCQELRQIQQTLPTAKDHEPEVIFLGTASALPSKYRNTSCILVNFQGLKDATVILDCGEDSYGQIFRFYGPERTAEVLKRLKLIYVSHHHVDHHIGLIEILRHRQALTNEPVVLLLPPGVDLLIDYHDENFDNLDGSYLLYQTRMFRPDIEDASSELIRKDLFEKLGSLLIDMKIVPVDHCINSCAAVFKFNIGRPDMDTFTLAYSGDARPSDKFVKAGLDCDLLIHEATFDHRGLRDAVNKRHSTTHEAIRLGKAMRAKMNILTHFSAKYPRIPYLTDQFDEQVGFAFDNMTIRCPSHYKRIPILKKAVMNLFAKHLNSIDERYLRQEMVSRLLNEGKAETHSTRSK